MGPPTKCGAVLSSTNGPSSRRPLLVSFLGLFLYLTFQSTPPIAHTHAAPPAQAPWYLPHPQSSHSLTREKEREKPFPILIVACSPPIFSFTFLLFIAALGLRFLLPFLFFRFLILGFSSLIQRALLIHSFIHYILRDKAIITFLENLDFRRKKDVAICYTHFFLKIKL